MGYEKIILDKIEVAKLRIKQINLDTVYDLAPASYWQGYLDACNELLLALAEAEES